MDATRRLFIAATACCGSLLSIEALAQGQGKGQGKGEGKAKKPHHNNGARKLGDPKGKPDGKHKIEKNGPAEVSVDLKGGKIAAFHAKHDKKGDLPVKKYRTKKQMAAADELQTGIVRVQYYLGTEYIGYSYYDDWGDEVIYWFPYDLVLDPWTGAVEYVAAY